ncbi:MAG: hypothetical protein IMF19_12065 [Proteobacteria bacterium]|nr:hypothetical protein [Pseudomonadota bacterium]
MLDKQIQELEDKIAHLCNAFVSDTQSHINTIQIYYGPCEKGWFSDEAINIHIDAYWKALCEFKTRGMK